jgi:hypothetical protein
MPRAGGPSPTAGRAATAGAFRCTPRPGSTPPSPRSRRGARRTRRPVEHLPALPTRARHQDRARPVAGADEDVLGPRRRVDEVSRAQLPLLPSTSSRHSPATPMVSRRGLAGQRVAAGRLRRGWHGGSPRRCGPPATAGRRRQGGGPVAACPHRQGLEGQRSWPSTRPAAAPTGPPRPSTCSSRGQAGRPRLPATSPTTAYSCYHTAASRGRLTAPQDCEAPPHAWWRRAAFSRTGRNGSGSAPFSMPIGASLGVTRRAYAPISLPAPSVTAR